MPGPELGGQWGILGGTFDPVHYGHLTLADEIQTAKNLTGILFVPSHYHPFKRNQCKASFADRVAMLKLALADYPSFGISEIETEKKLSGYTYDTIRALKEQYPDARFWFVIGADNLTQIQKWHNYEKLLREVPFLAGTRPGYAPDTPDYFPPGSIEYVQTKPVDIASSEVRKLLESKSSMQYLEKIIPLSVLEYINSRNLYQ